MRSLHSFTDRLPEIRFNFLHAVNRKFAITVPEPGWARGLSACSQHRVARMASLRRIKAASVRVAPHWFLCIFLGAYVTLQMATPSVIVG